MATTTFTLDGTDGPEEVTVTGVPRAVWSRLMDAHPPAGDGKPHGPGFVLALIRAAVTSHQLDGETASDLLDDTDIGENLETTVLALSTPGIRAGLLARLEHDHRLQAELSVCTEMGIPRSAFLSWPDDDQDLAVAWWVRRHDTCPGCGVPTADMRRPSAPWTVDQQACIWCSTRHAAEEETPPEHRHAVHVSLTRAGGGDA